MLQKYDAERDKVQCNRIAAAAWGGEVKDAPKPSANGRKQTMTQQDLTRNYAK